MDSICHAIKPGLMAWGRQTLRQELGGFQDPKTKAWHFDGWSKQSTIAQFKTMKDAAGSHSERTLRQFNEEAYKGEALEIWRAIRRTPLMPEDLYWTLFAHYVVPGDCEEKIKALNVSRNTYFQHLNLARHFIVGRMSFDRPQRRAG